MKRQLVPSHDEVAFAGGTHGVHDAPQLETLPLSAQAPPQTWNPALHVIPHDTPSQVALPLAGVEHGEQDDGPQLLVLLLLTHTPPQLWKLALHVNPQLVPSHVAVAFAGIGHARHELPHEVRL